MSNKWFGSQNLFGGFTLDDDQEHSSASALPSPSNSIHQNQSRMNNNNNNNDDDDDDDKPSLFFISPSPPPLPPSTHSHRLHLYEDKYCYQCRTKMDDTRASFHYNDSIFCTPECRNLRIAIEEAAEQAKIVAEKKAASRITNR